MFWFDYHEWTEKTVFTLDKTHVHYQEHCQIYQTWKQLAMKTWRSQVQLPASLNELVFGTHFDSTLDGVVFPPSLLYLGCFQLVQLFTSHSDSLSDQNVMLCTGCIRVFLCLCSCTPYSYIEHLSTIYNVRVFFVCVCVRYRLYWTVCFDKNDKCWKRQLDRIKAWHRGISDREPCGYFIPQMMIFKNWAPLEKGIYISLNFW